MYRQMMKRKHPSSSPLLEEGDTRRMAEELTRELERGIKLSPESKRPRTIPLHDPFFVGTPEEAALHLQRLEGRMKRKSEDVTILNNEMQLLGSNPQVQEMPNNNRGCKIPRRSRAQASVVDIDALNRKLSTFDLSDTTDTNANPCRALTLYSPNPLAHPTITSTDDFPDLNDEPSGPEASLLSRYRNRFPFKIEDLSKALIIYPEQHPLQPVIDKIRDYEQRTGRGNVRIQEIGSSSSCLDDIDDDDDHAARMIFEDQNGSTRYVVEEEDSEAEEDSIDEAYPTIDPGDRFEELTDCAFLPTSSASTSTSSSSSSPFLASNSTPFTTSPTTPSSLFSSSQPSPFAASSSSSFAASPSPFASSSSSSLFMAPSSSSSSSFFSAPPVFSNISPFPSSSPFATSSSFLPS